MKKFFCGLAILLLVSCAKNVSEPVMTLRETPTSGPVITATRSPPSKTPSPTSFPTNTPAALLSTYSFPAWMSDPATNILAALVTDDAAHTRKISFFNAATGESYEIFMPRDVSGYFWYDNENFGLLSKDMETAHQISLKTGKVLSEPVSPETTRFLHGEYEYDDYENSYGDTANALEIINDTNTNEFLFRKTRYGEYGTKSRNGRFSANWSGESNTQISAIDNHTNRIIWESEPFQDGYYGTVFRWSPQDESLVAYIQGKPAELSDFITQSVTLTIVDVVTGKVLAKYTGDFGRMAWSPDGKKILYEGAETIYENYGVRFTEAPCILFLNIEEKRCLRSIPRFIPEGYELVTTGVYKWGPDNQTIFYTYIYGKEGNSIGNLCMYSLVTSYIDCPTDNLEVLRGMSVINHDVSPDQQFLHFCYSASSILNDYADTSYDGVIRVDGTGFFSWVGAIHDGAPFETCSGDALWRPPP